MRYIKKNINKNNGEETMNHYTWVADNINDS